jgi:two-component system, cell cycle sensor histidine kinase and response regulator CckA
MSEDAAGPLPVDHAVVVLDLQRVRWTSDPRGPSALFGLFHGDGAERSWRTTAGGPLRRADLPPFRALADHRPVPTELLGHRQPDGTTRWLRLTARPVDWHGDRAVSVVVEEAGAADPLMCSWALDVTHGVVESALVTNGPVPDIGGTSIWGLAADERPAPLSAYLALVVESDVPRVRQALARAAEGSAQELTVGVSHPSGERRWFHLLVGRDGDARTLTGLTRDVTAHHDAEIVALRIAAQLGQTARLEGLAQLAAGIAHDVNNLLGAVGIQVEMAQRAVVRGESPAAFLADLRSAVDRGVDLTRQLLAFSRLDDGHPQPIDVNLVATQVRDLTRGLLPGSIAQRLDPAPDLPAVALAPGQLEQVLTTLVVNARDAMPGGGTLTVSTAAVADAETGRPWVRVSVADTGTGMDEATAARACEPFFTTKPRDQSTGLGLAVAHGIVTRNGGRLQIDTAPGHGTRMHVAFPPAPETFPAATAGRRPGNGRLVLVVEDDSALRTVVGRALADAGYTTVTTDDPRVAVATVRTAPMPVVISDVVLPDLSGAELAAQLRALHPGLPVLLMSGGQDDRRLVAPADVITLHKPFTIAALITAVGHALASPPLG